MTGPSGHASAQLGWVAQLRSAALALTGHGWPVLRGTYHDGRAGRGHPHDAGLRPVEDDWTTRWTVQATQVARWWADEPYSVLVACGHGVDCVELATTPAASHRMLGPLGAAGLCPPALRTPVDTLVLFVRTPTNPPPHPLLVSVSLRSTGAWMALPPTGHHDRAGAGWGPYRWVANCSPGHVGWALPELRPVCGVITATVRAGVRQRPVPGPIQRPGPAG